jgi:hypothetical protein
VKQLEDRLGALVAAVDLLLRESLPVSEVPDGVRVVDLTQGLGIVIPEGGVGPAS